MEAFCDGNLDMPLRIQLLDWGETGNRQVGYVDTTPRFLLGAVTTEGNADRSRALDIHRGNGDNVRSTDKVGILVVVEATLVENSLLDSLTIIVT